MPLQHARVVGIFGPRAGHACGKSRTVVGHWSTTKAHLVIGAEDQLVDRTPYAVAPDPTRYDRV
jgi:hypothetical protein